MSNELFVWLNQNQGAVIAVLTFVYVIVTTIYVIASVKIVKKMKKSNDLVRESNELSRQTIVQSMEFEKQRNRPYVIFDLIAKNRCFYAIIKNIGRQPAYEVRITTEPEIVRNIRKYEKISFVQHEIPFLAPDREIEDFIDTTPNFLKKHPEIIFTVNISYKDSLGELYKETNNVSVAFFMNHMSVSIDDPIKKVETHIDKMVAILQETQKSLQQMTWVQNRFLESGILKREPIEKNIVNRQEDELNLTKEEINYLLKIADQEGKIYHKLLSAFSGRDTEIYREMLNKFVQISLMREELDYWALTAKGYKVCDELRQQNDPNNDKNDTIKTNG